MKTHNYKWALKRMERGRGVRRLVWLPGSSAGMKENGNLYSLDSAHDTLGSWEPTEEDKHATDWVRTREKLHGHKWALRKISNGVAITRQVWGQKTVIIPVIGFYNKAALANRDLWSGETEWLGWWNTNGEDRNADDWMRAEPNALPGSSSRLDLGRLHRKKGSKQC